MGFGDAFKDFVSGAGAAASAAKDKINDGATILRLESEIKQTQGEIDRCTAEIGRQYAIKHAGDFSGEFGNYLSQIAAAQAKIRSVQEQINAIKGTKQCSSCGADIDIDAAVCVKCGAQQEKSGGSPRVR